MKTLSTWFLTLFYVLALFFLLMLFSGCGAPPPPAYFSIDEKFSEPERETIRSVFDAWCVAVDYCPTEALWAERGAVILVDDLPEDDYTRRVCPEGRDCTTAGTNDNLDAVLVAANRPQKGLDALWWVVAHEVGHYCTEHTETGLMGRVAPDDRELVIDDVAIAAWHECNVQEIERWSVH